MAQSEAKQEEDPVSFTDTNAETGAAGGNGSSSNMMDLIGDLSKKEKASNKDASNTSDTDRKKKKKKKGKTKKVRKHDRYEPENFLFRIEGSIVCGSLWILMLYLISNAIVLTIVIIMTKTMDVDKNGSGMQHTFCCFEDDK